MFKNTYLYTLATSLLAVMLFASCSENEQESDEYANWQVRNTEYFKKIYDMATTTNDASWKVIPKWSLQGEVASLPEEHIVVHILQQDEDPVYPSPLFTDSAYVNYRGRIIPTEHNLEGKVFDQTYKTENYIPELARPKLLCVGGTIDGFTTALMNMHIGDRWEVYIPYQLGYGTVESGSVPAFSTLIFEMSLMAYYRPGSPVPSWK